MSAGVVREALLTDSTSRTLGQMRRSLGGELFRLKRRSVQARDVPGPENQGGQR